VLQFLLAAKVSLHFIDGASVLPCIIPRATQVTDFYFQIGSVSLTMTALQSVSYFVWLHHKVQPDIRVDPITRSQT
jgi:hypothetical protein